MFNFRWAMKDKDDTNPQLQFRCMFDLQLITEGPRVGEIIIVERPGATWEPVMGQIIQPEAITEAPRVIAGAHGESPEQLAKDNTTAPISPTAKKRRIK